MRGSVGRVRWTSPSGAVERDAITCSHCGSIRVVPVKGEQGDLGGFCRMCMRSLCGKCAADGKCTPLEKRLEAAERADRLMRSIQ